MLRAIEAEMEKDPDAALTRLSDPETIDEEQSQLNLNQAAVNVQDQLNNEELIGLSQQPL